MIKINTHETLHCAQRSWKYLFVLVVWSVKTRIPPFGALLADNTITQGDIGGPGSLV